MFSRYILYKKGILPHMSNILLSTNIHEPYSGEIMKTNEITVKSKIIENRPQHKAALITAAGMSSRMGKFKPLLEFGNSTIIETEISKFYKAGIEKVYVVIGNNAGLLSPVLKKAGAQEIYNPEFEITQMLDSVKLGLKYILSQKNYDRLFFIPGDIPAFRFQSLKTIQEVMDKTGADVVRPEYKGKHGHPILFNEEAGKYLLNYNGEYGIKGALNSYKGNIETALVPDPGMTLDADTLEDYKIMFDLEKHSDIPDRELCTYIAEIYNMREDTLSHCKKVASLALDLAHSLNLAGHYINEDLVQAAALLHDIKKGEKHHDILGAKLLGGLGYPKVAEIIAAHMNLPEDAAYIIDERAVVYLADKRVSGKDIVPLEERFYKKMNLYENDEDVLKIIKNRLDSTLELQKRIENITR